MQIRMAVGGTVLINLTDTDGITLGGAAGTIDIYISDTQTEAIAVRRAVYDLYIQFAAGDRTRLLEGKVVIDPAVTADP